MRNTTYRWLTVSALATGLLALAVAPSAHADRLDAPVPLGGSVTLTIGSPGDSASTGFLISEAERTKVTIQVKRAKRSPLEFDVRITQPDGTPFDPVAFGGKAKGKSTKFKATWRGVPASGLWRVEVTGINGTAGDCLVIVKGKDALKTGATDVVPAGRALEIPLQLGANTIVTVKTKRGRGAAIVPELQLLDPNGDVVLDVLDAIGNEKKGTAQYKKLPVPFFGLYTLLVSGKDGIGGGISFSVKSAPRKIKGAVPGSDPGTAFEVEPGTEGRLDGSGSGVGPGATFRWTQVSGVPAVLSDLDTQFPTFTAPSEIGPIAFELSVEENGILSRGVPVAVEVSRRPVADAGRSRFVAAGANVTLDGTGSLGRGAGPLTFAWQQLASDAVQVALDDPTSPTPSFDAPQQDAILHFGLLVDDGVARSDEIDTGISDVVVISVGNAGRSVADAGREQYVGRMATVHLSALASIRPGQLLDGGIQWRQVAGPAVDLQGADTVSPAFTAPREFADLMFELEIDGDPFTKDMTQVYVRPEEFNLPPRTVGNGPLSGTGGLVNMSGSATVDPENDDPTFHWAQLLGPALAMQAPDAEVNPVDLPGGNEIHLFAVHAHDGVAYGPPDVVRVVNTGYSGQPLANAGPDVNGFAGVPVVLDGTAWVRTDGQNLPVTLRWDQVSANDWYDVEADDPNWDPAAGMPTFTIPIGLSSLTPTRTMTFQVTVDDGNLVSFPDFVTVTFTGLPLNGVPIVTADADVKTPLVGEVVTLTGTAVDLDGDPLTVLWNQTAGPLVNLSPGPGVLAPTFAAPATGPVIFEFTADDGFDTSVPAQVVIDVNERPIADIVTTPPSGGSGTVVTMDGRGSNDPEGQPITFKWTQTAGTAVPFTDTDDRIQFTAPLGAVSFTLVVNDGLQDSLPAFATFASQNPPDTAPTTSLAAAPYGAQVQLFANPPANSGALTFSWKQTAGPTVSGFPSTVEDPTFTVPLPTGGTFGANPKATFEVTATDGQTTSAPKTVDVNFFASFNDPSNTTGVQSIMKIVLPKCSNCHSGSSNACPVGSGSNASGYGMKDAAAFIKNTINVKQCVGPKNRVTPSNPTGSLLLDRLKGTVKPGTMPPSTPLTAAEINFFEDWISQGAKTNN